MHTYYLTNRQGTILIDPSQNGWIAFGDIDLMLNRFDFRLLHIYVPADETGGAPISHVALSTKIDGEYNNALLAFQWFGGKLDMQNALLETDIPANISNAAASVMLFIAQYARRLLGETDGKDILANYRTHALNSFAEILTTAKSYTQIELITTNNVAKHDPSIWLRNWLISNRLPAAPVQRLRTLIGIAQSLWQPHTIREWNKTLTDNIALSPNQETNLRRGIENLETLATAYGLLTAKNPTTIQFSSLVFKGRAAFLHRIATNLSTGPHLPTQTEVDWLTLQDYLYPPQDEQYYYSSNITDDLPPNVFGYTALLPQDQELLSDIEEKILTGIPSRLPYLANKQYQLIFPEWLKRYLGIELLRLVFYADGIYLTAIHRQSRASYSSAYWTPQRYQVDNDQSAHNLSLSFPARQQWLMRGLLAALWFDLSTIDATNLPSTGILFWGTDDERHIADSIAYGRNVPLNVQRSVQAKGLIIVAHIVHQIAQRKQAVQ